MVEMYVPFASIQSLARFNPFQIKNIVMMAGAVARHQGRRLLLPQLEAEIKMREEFDRDIKGASAIENERSYV